MRRMILSVLVVTSLLLLSKAIINATPAQGPMSYLPIVARPLPPTNTPTIPPPTATVAPPTQTPGPPPTNTPLATPIGGNVVCREVDREVIQCAWVDDPNPAYEQHVKVFGRKTTNSVGGPGLLMRATWRFGLRERTCDAYTNVVGIASCDEINRADTPSAGHVVPIDVTMGGTTVQTWYVSR